MEKISERASNTLNMNVYDFDNTVYDGESAIDFFKFYLKKDPSLLKNVPSLIVAVIKYKSGNITVEEALSKYGTKVTEYFKKNSSSGALRKDTVVFWNQHARNIKPFYKTMQQEDDLIITCSPEFSIREIAGRLGIKHYICTKMNEETGEITRMCFRENKVKAFREEYPDSEIENLYTDSMNDKPLMDISKNVYLVKGDKITKIK